MSEIYNQTLIDLVSDYFGSKIIEVKESYETVDFVVDKDVILDMVLWLKNHELLKVNFLTSICGVHFPTKTGQELSVVYHLHSLTNNLRFRIHVFLPAQKPEIPTLTKVFAAANWMERETFEFYGINFIGHPDLRIILNEEDMNYHPLLKQYPLVDATRTDKDDKYFGR
ncbi:MAG: NADH-quinone oxidoreductase subunit C [Saprospiraceae bacterium]|jgi:NADH-quinone oxidoreductase subunit C